MIADICRHINEKVKDDRCIYYTIENNSIGEAAIVSLNDFGEINIPGYFLTEPGTKRRGFNTSHKPKIAACAKLKTLIESQRMIINSRPLISELKTFVASGVSYAAKPGEHDDLVMATVLIVRMLGVLQNYHQELDGQISDHSDNTIEPMPFVVMIS